MNKFSLTICILCVTCSLVAQPLGITFQEAESKGIIIKSLDIIYLSAVHVDTTLAVFTTDEEQALVVQEYSKLMQEFGSFLKTNHFIWEKPMKCFNRIYFNQDGAIDYFIFNFRGTPEEKPTAEQELEFTRLLNLFISDYKTSLKADTKFAQCSPVTYMP